MNKRNNSILNERKLSYNVIRSKCYKNSKINLYKIYLFSILIFNLIV